MALTSLANVTIEDDLTVDRHRNLVAHGTYLLAVPLAHRSEVDTLRHDDAIDRAVLLIVAQTGIDGCIVVEYLNFHAFVGSIHALAGTDANAIVHTLL